MVKGEIQIRPASLTDLAEIQELFRETINQVCKRDYSPEQIEVWISAAVDSRKWEQKISDQYFIVAEQNNMIIGFASLESGNYLDLLYVHYEHLRKGIASLLLDQIVKESINTGHDKIHSNVSITARSFFESKGFKIRKENKIMKEGVELINYLMSR